ncbi:hypothetical protein B296_00054548 [Ensete ventricosum]|uniref:Uncharacterized protein n=1 Tax=Ensete ventricosum TaxID=4639 RepID=A0A426X1P8_ENSVE|nr:hypothetical protein B296_00054548 [Ensete ventricosum]
MRGEVVVDRGYVAATKVVENVAVRSNGGGAGDGLWVAVVSDMLLTPYFPLYPLAQGKGLKVPVLFHLCRYHLATHHLSSNSTIDVFIIDFTIITLYHRSIIGYRYTNCNWIWS